MSSTQMPGMPGAGVMTDTLEFVKNLWGSMGVPGIGMPGMSAMGGMAMPTMSVEDLDKKIGDLKAVESWLNLNVSMLHGSIQALEVQRATISTLQSMGSALAAAVKQPENRDPAKLFESVPYASAFFTGSQAAQADSKPEAARAAPAAAPTAAPAPAAANPADFAAQAGNPAAWWNLLQDQFKQAVGTAMGGGEALANMNAAGAKMAGEAAAKMRVTPTEQAKPAKPPKPAAAATPKPRKPAVKAPLRAKAKVHGKT